VVFEPFLFGFCAGIVAMLLVVVPLCSYAKRAEAARQRQSPTP
jgi:hypothetical protein